MSEKPESKKEIKDLGHDVVYRPHKEVADHSIV